MTGDAVSTYSLEPDGGWERLELRPEPHKTNKRKCGLFTTGDRQSGGAMFNLVRQFKAKGCVLGAGSRGKDETLTTGRGDGGGIVPGSARRVGIKRL